jgi:hypothetical protein
MYVAPDSLSGFNSEDNLLHQGADPNARVGYWGGALADSLADWRAVSGQDARSVAADPLFLDRDGADNVLGFRSGTGGNPDYDGGPDDNFFVRRNSPAIDRGDGWAAARFDIDGHPRRDDPGTTNRGTPDYAETALGSSLFAAGGAPQGWTFNDFAWTLSLPFAFPFYDATYSSVQVSSEGFLHFAGPDSAGAGANSLATLLNNRRIAPLWDNLRTDGAGDDIFVNTSVAGQITIRWNATNETDGSDVNLAVTLFSDGRVRFDYGPGNTNLTPTIGLSFGEGRASTLSNYDGRAALTHANSVEFALGPGFVDLGAYEFPGSSLDAAPPVVNGSLPAGVFASSNDVAGMNRITLMFVEPLNYISARSPALFALLEAGPDGAFDTGDEVNVPLAGVSYAAGALGVELSFAAPLPEGRYRLTLLGGGGNAVFDLAGNALDGDGNGAAGGTFVREFTVNNPPAVLATIVNDGSPQRSRVTRLALQFSENVGASLAAADVTLRNLTTGANVTGFALAYDAATNRATLTFAALPGQQLPEGNYLLTVLAAGVTDTTGKPMAANQSFTFHVLTGDVTGDRVTNDLDLYQVWQNLLQPPASRNVSHDLDGDGQVTPADVDLVRSRYLASLPTPAPPPNPAGGHGVAAAAGERPAGVDAAQADAPVAAVAPLPTRGPHRRVEPGAPTPSPEHRRTGPMTGDPDDEFQPWFKRTLNRRK